MVVCVCNLVFIIPLHAARRALAAAPRMVVLEKRVVVLRKRVVVSEKKDGGFMVKNEQGGT